MTDITWVNVLARLLVYVFALKLLFALGEVALIVWLSLLDRRRRRREREVIR